MERIPILILNGPNLNLLGHREPERYGNISMEEYLIFLKNEFQFFEIDYFQSNNESEIVDKIQAAKKVYNAIVINPAAYTHSSIAIRDSLLATQILTIEVHLTDISQRETFRHHSMISDLCWCTIKGFGLESYKIALSRLQEYFNMNVEI
ncbi:MAG: 3-dehydroquinate dehydratase [Saprospiraceae bacterium]|nr:3-dehydroquinate dehydratase [Saprospiraceae bacterium]